MKRSYKFLAFGSSFAMMLGLASCANDLSDQFTQNESGSIQLVHAPDVIAWSGDQVLGNTVGTRTPNVNANEWDGWNCVNNVEDDLTPEDIQKIIELFKIGQPVENTIILPWENYFVQQVYKGEDKYYSHDRCEQAGCDHINRDKDQILGSGQMDHLKAWNSNVTETQYGGYWDSSLNQWVQVITENHYEHINNFNEGDNTNDPNNCPAGKTHKGTTLMKNMGLDGVTPNNQFGYDESWGTDPKFFNNYIIIKYKDWWFVGFDYEAHKNDQTTHNHNEGMDINRDWNFTDWIVRITPAYHDGEIPTEPEGTPVVPNPYPGNESDNCDKCKHESHGDTCPKCQEEGKGGCYTDGGNGGNTGEGEKNPVLHNNEVEVNYAINDVHNNGEEQKYKTSDLWTKLSIHVRKGTDVKIRIPLPTKYIVESDDFAIFEKHIEGFGVYNGDEELHLANEAKVHRQQYTISKDENTSWIVTLTVTINEGDVEDGYIEVETDGITEELIEYLFEEYGDGINFEVWNYFQTEYKDENGEVLSKNLDRDKLKGFLDRSTIEFLDEIPAYYINAFGLEDVDEDGNPESNDYNIGDKNHYHAIVKPAEKYDNTYIEKDNLYHLNGTSYNHIYYFDIENYHDDAHVHGATECLNGHGTTHNHNN